MPGDDDDRETDDENESAEEEEEACICAAIRVGWTGAAKAALTERMIRKQLSPRVRKFAQARRPSLAQRLDAMRCDATRTPAPKGVPLRGQAYGTQSRTLEKRRVGALQHTNISGKTSGNNMMVSHIFPCHKFFLHRIPLVCLCSTTLPINAPYPGCC